MPYPSGARDRHRGGPRQGEERHTAGIGHEPTREQTMS